MYSSVFSPLPLAKSLFFPMILKPHFCSPTAIATSTHGFTRSGSVRGIDLTMIRRKFVNITNYFSSNSGLHYPGCFPIREGPDWNKGGEVQVSTIPRGLPLGASPNSWMRVRWIKGPEETPNAQHPRHGEQAVPNVGSRITPERRRGRRGAVGRRRERSLAWAVFRAPVFYWVTRQRRVAD